MRDRFFEVENCDRCGKPLNGCRIQSMYNHEVLCMDCKDKETQREDYRQAVEADHAEIRRGNYNFEGINSFREGKYELIIKFIFAEQTAKIFKLQGHDAEKILTWGTFFIKTMEQGMSSMPQIIMVLKNQQNQLIKHIDIASKENKHLEDLL